MSQENVELVMGLHLAPDVDFAELIRDDERWTAASAFASQFVHPDAEYVLPRFDSTQTFTGMDGFRALWLDWMTPWATYRTEIEEAIDLGDQVLVLLCDFGRRAGSTHEVALTAAGLWTVRDGKIVRAEFYAERTEALKAVGLEE